LNFNMLMKLNQNLYTHSGIFLSLYCNYTMILDKLNFFYFILSFSIGLFVCYITNPQPEIILKFPSPTNAGKVTYKDKAGECYAYKAEKINCPQETKYIKPQPILEDFRNYKKGVE
jgi:hypothetical protein